MMSNYEIELVNNNLQEFHVKFQGPEETPFEDGIWIIRVEVPDQYPYKSPSIGFVNRIFHPNIDEASGAVCLDVINQTWSPMFGLINIFEIFLPQLLRYPNPSDPLNGEAAALFLRDSIRYEHQVKEYINKYARPDGCLSGARSKLPETQQDSQVETMHSQRKNETLGSDNEISSVSSYSDDAEDI